MKKLSLISFILMYIFLIPDLSSNKKYTSLNIPSNKIKSDYVSLKKDITNFDTYINSLIFAKKDNKKSSIDNTILNSNHHYPYILRINSQLILSEFKRCYDVYSSLDYTLNSIYSLNNHTSNETKLSQQKYLCSLVNSNCASVESVNYIISNINLKSASNFPVYLNKYVSVKKNLVESCNLIKSSSILYYTKKNNNSN